MIRMMRLGYCCSIRSDRRLCQEVDTSFADRWFCGLGLEGRVPDHSTFSVNRHGRFRDSNVRRRVFDRVLLGCMAAGLVRGEGFAVDASVIEADARRFKRVKGAEIDWTDAEPARRAIRENLEALEGGKAPTNPERAPKAMSPTDPCAGSNVTSTSQRALSPARSWAPRPISNQGANAKKIETLFADVKRNLGLTRLGLRGLTGARDEFLLVATGQNLKTPGHAHGHTAAETGCRLIDAVKTGTYSQKHQPRPGTAGGGIKKSAHSNSSHQKPRSGPSSSTLSAMSGGSGHAVGPPAPP